MPSEADDFLDRRRRAMAAYEEAYGDWFSALPAAEQKRLRALGLDKADVEQLVETECVDEGNEQRIPEIAIWPRDEDGQCDTLSADLADVSRCFVEAMAWAASGCSPVEVGQRAAVMMHLMRPALVVGLAVEILAEKEAEARSIVGGREERVGEHYGRVFEWLRRGRAFSQIGLRVLAMLYVLGSQNVQGMTLAQIGAASQKTRQAVDKLAQDFRDTFGGLRSRTMRSEDNRNRCRQAQLNDPKSPRC